MSSSAHTSRRARRTQRARQTRSARPISDLIIEAVLVAAIGAVGVVATWPIYRDAWLMLTAGAGLALGVGIAAVSTSRRWRWWLVALVTAGVYLVVGIPLGAPSALTEPSQLPTAALQVATAPVTGWKNLLTLDLPLGTYQATLAPTLLVFLVVPLVSLTLAWRGAGRWTLAAPVALVMPLFGILFGSSAVRGVLAAGPLVVPGVVELLTGVAGLLLALGWYVWRTAAGRRQAVDRAQSASGIRVRRSSGAAAGRWAIAGAMALVAVLIGVVAAPIALAGTARDVLRTDIDPDEQVRTALSPLSTYREFFSDNEYDQVLFQVSTDDGTAADRVRLATLSFYDGIVARVEDPDSEDTAFVRVPSGDSSAATTTTTVTIDGYSGIWVPLVGDLTSISFQGSSRSALSDGFYFSADADMGVQLSDPGLVSGVSYTETSVVTASDDDIAALEPGGSGPSISAEVVPTSLTDWITAQDAPSGGAGLELLIDRIRARGYLSHALTYDAESPPSWATDLGDYSFEPSRSGHSTDRIDTLFTDLLDRQNDVGGTDDAALVATAGDDEQFAVAAALIADQLGFTTRIVLGARLATGDDSDLSACENGQCEGQDMSAWIEVQDASGAWVAIDTTPQHTNPIAPEVEQRSDPQVPTDVRPEQADIVPPPDAAPADNGQNDDEETATALDLTGLWAGLRIAGVVALIGVVLFGPFLAVLLAKTLRRRARRDATDPVERVVGGWDEYVDAAVDQGAQLPRTQTRQELAALYDQAGAGAPALLATWADRTVFAREQASPADGDTFWELLETERTRMLAGLGRWQRLRARLSLRSLRRSARSLTARADRARRGKN